MTTIRLDRDTRDDVTDLLVRYAEGIDGRDWEALRSCFTDDCDADYGEIGHWRSGDEITEWMANTHEPLGPTLHRMTNISLKPAESGLRARSYVHAVITDGQGGVLLQAYGYYDDDVVQGADGWRIARRRFTSAAVAPA